MRIIIITIIIAILCAIAFCITAIFRLPKYLLKDHKMMATFAIGMFIFQATTPILNAVNGSNYIVLPLYMAFETSVLLLFYNQYITKRFLNKSIYVLLSLWVVGIGILPYFIPSWFAQLWSIKLYVHIVIVLLAVFRLIRHLTNFSSSAVSTDKFIHLGIFIGYSVSMLFFWGLPLLVEYLFSQSFVFFYINMAAQVAMYILIGFAFLKLKAITESSTKTLEGR